MGFLRTSKFLAASMANQLTERFNRLVKTVRGEARLTESNLQDALREVRLALIEADVALPVVKAFIERVKTAALGAEVATSLTPGRGWLGPGRRPVTFVATAYGFALTDEEYLDLYLEDLELPDLAKRQIAGAQALQWRQAGFSTSGPPSRISVPRTAA